MHAPQPLQHAYALPPFNIFILAAAAAAAAGPGAQCDGEDWFSISTIPQLDYTTIHVYERHMELLPRPSGASMHHVFHPHCVSHAAIIL
jgi:hypothetical protein